MAKVVAQSYLVVGVGAKQNTIKLNDNPFIKNIFFSLARKRILTKTVFDLREDLYQHIYVDKSDAENIGRFLVCELMQRSIHPDNLTMVMEKIEYLWKFAKERTAVFTLESHSYVSVMLCELAGTQSASKIDLMVSNFNLIRDLYEMAGFNMKKPDHLFYESSDLKSIKTDPESLKFKTG